MDSRTVIIIGAAVLVLLLMQPGQGSGGGAAPVRRVPGGRVFGATPHYNAYHGGPGYYGAGDYADGLNPNVIDMVDAPPLAGRPTFPALNSIPVDSDGTSVFPATAQDNRVFGPRPANWPTFTPWPPLLAKAQAISSARIAVGRILHPPTGKGLGMSEGASSVRIGGSLLGHTVRV